MGRHTCLERAVKMFLDQDYTEKVLFIYQNSDIFQELDPEYNWGNRVILANQSKNLQDKPYSSLGDIYNNALQVLNFMQGFRRR